MLAAVAWSVVLLTGFYLIGLAGVSLFAPVHASRFLMGFAGSAAMHYVELLLRILIGAAFLYSAAKMPVSVVFALFGGLLVVTTGVLMFIPWKWHRRFAEWAVPKAIANLKLVAASSLFAGVGIVAAAIAPLMS